MTTSTLDGTVGLVDVLIIGGGVNGAGIARDAAGRGLSVVLCEKDDLAAHTSSASTKLIHGGLRYLEHHEFGLVRKSLIEREVLMRSAPHIMWPLRFVMPHDDGQRPAWLIRAGLFLYDHLARRELLPSSQAVTLTRHPAGTALKPALIRGFEYSDGWVDDARLVVLNAVDAAEKGARILTRTRCESVEQRADEWHALLRTANGRPIQIRARSLVNATGPWVSDFLQNAARQAPARSIRLVKGSHIVVRKLFDHPYAYLLQNHDGRIVFAIPFQQDFTLIGTTDVEQRDNPGCARIEPDEIDYLCRVTERYFRQAVQPADVVWSYSGVRPLVDDDSANASAVTRDYRLECSTGGPPLLSVFGGKITTFRKLAEEAVNLLAPQLLNHAGPWTAHACLPGGDLFGSVPCNRSVLEFESFAERQRQQTAWLDATIVSRYARLYGTRIAMLLDGRHSCTEMGELLAPGLYAAEVEYLMRHEWAMTAADVLWRRTKLGLHASPAMVAKLDQWMRQRDNSPRLEQEKNVQLPSDNVLMTAGEDKSSAAS